MSAHTPPEPRIATLTSHLAQLRKSPFDTSNVDKSDGGLTAADVRSALESAEHFVFTAIPDDDEEVKASVEAMKEAGVWRLPYRVCTFEYMARLNVYESDELDAKVRAAFGGKAFHCISLCAEREDGEPGVIATFIKADPGDKHSWVSIYHRRPPHTTIGDLSDPGVIKAYQEGLRRGGMSVVGLGVGNSDSVGAITSGCLVALATKGIRRERWIGDKKVLVGRKEPRDAYTRVMVAECMDTGQGHSVPGERHKVRLHLRRGHIRNQPHGPGRRYTRAIYIQPMLIGYEEEGRITHDHYEAYPQEHTHA